MKQIILTRGFSTYEETMAFCHCFGVYGGGEDDAVDWKI